MTADGPHQSRPWPPSSRSCRTRPTRSTLRWPCSPRCRRPAHPAVGRRPVVGRATTLRAFTNLRIYELTDLNWTRAIRQFVHPSIDEPLGGQPRVGFGAETAVRFRVAEVEHQPDDQPRCEPRP